jgi:phosphonate transport system substrate-binding protein
VASGEPSTPSPSTARIRVGIALAGGPTRAQLDAFCWALASATGFEVAAVGLWYYRRLLAAMDVGDVDVAWLPPILAAQAVSNGFATPLALPVRGGVAAYSTALFARQDGPIQSLGDLTGVRAAWVDRQSASGYLLIRAHLRTLGVDLDRAFRSEVFSGSHDAVTRAVIDGDADVGASFFHVGAGGAPTRAERPATDPGLGAMLRSPTGAPPARPSAPGAKAALRPEPSSPETLRAGWGDARVRILAHAGPIPSDVIAANSRLDAAIMERVQRALTEARQRSLREASWALLGAEGFVAPSPGHLDPLLKLLPGLDPHALAPPPIWPRG